MGLLICIVSFALGFAAVVTAGAQLCSDIVDPEGIGGTPFVVILIALCALSALFGARKHQHWLSDHLTGAALSGVAAGTMNGAALLAFGSRQRGERVPLSLCCCSSRASRSSSGRPSSCTARSQQLAVVRSEPGMRSSPVVSIGGGE